MNSSVWSLEPKGEVEKLEATGLGSEVKGVSANLVEKVGRRPCHLSKA